MCSNELKKIGQSWGGVLTITCVLIVIIFALFTTTGPGKKTAGNQTRMDTEDMLELKAKQQAGQQRNITVRQGQKLVVF